MKVLITGIGIVGKSTLRRQLLKKLQTAGAKVEHFDADCFGEIRHPLDTTCLKKIPKEFSDDVVYLIEDVHATMDQAVLPLSVYDLIIYLEPSFFTQILFWLPRMNRWFALGHYSWEKETGWQGNGRPGSLSNLPGILKDFFRDIYNRKRWITDDWQKIGQCKNVQVVRPSWSRQGPRFTF